MMHDGPCHLKAPWDYGGREIRFLSCVEIVRTRLDWPLSLPL